MKLPLSFTLVPSRSAIIALTLIHGLALASVSVSQLLIALKISLDVAIAASLVYYLMAYLYRTGRHIISAITLRENGEIDLIYVDGRKVSASVERSSTVLHRFMVLELLAADRTRRLWLLPDMLTAEHWRYFTIWLRAMPPEQEQAPK